MDKKDKCCNSKNTLPKANELPIYKCLDDHDYYKVVQTPPTSLERGISHVRKSLKVYVGSLQNVKEQCKDVYETGVAHSKSTYDFITDEDNTLPRAAAITVGGLTGLLLGVRGGIFKKVFYSGTGMAIVAAVCYPKQFADYSQCGYNWTKNKTITVVKDTTGYDMKDLSLNIPEKIPFKTSFDEMCEKVKGIYGGDKKTEGDPGQGNPVDCDLYTNRKK